MFVTEKENCLDAIVNMEFNSRSQAKFEHNRGAIITVSSGRWQITI